MHQDFDSMTDEDIALLAQQGDADASEYLLNKYKNFVRSKARSYFLVGADHEDIVQEGMIGLFKAFRDFRPDKLASFHAFAEICVTRQIITAIKTATRQKLIPLNFLCVAQQQFTKRRATARCWTSSPRAAAPIRKSCSSAGKAM